MALDQITDRSTPLASLTKAASRIARSRSIEEMVETIRASARLLIGCEGIAVIRREGDLCHYVDEDAIGPLWKGQKFPISTCVSGWAMIHRQTVVIADIAKDPRIPTELYQRTFVRAVAMAPIRAEDPVGAIGAYWSQTYEPSRWEVETLEALAEAAAIAVENIGFQAHAVTAPAERVGDFSRDIATVSGIAAVPAILDVVLRMTGMGFAAVARVTDSRWVTCSALDHVGFGLGPGDELPIESTLCNEIRDHRQPVVFDDATADAVYCDHHTPRIYGLRGYISVPIILGNGSFWGTLCAIDPNPATVNNPQVLGAFKLFAELIAHHLDADERLKATEASLSQERELALFREQFIAVLGHDLRNPIAAVNAGTSRLIKEGFTERSPLILKLMKTSISRMSGLVDNILDLARSRLGGGIVLNVQDGDLNETLQHATDELKAAYPDREVNASFAFGQNVELDHMRMAQMFSNLLSNAITHGAQGQPINVSGLMVNGEIEVSVSNGGRPIPADQIEMLFHPFRRGDAKSGVQGLGLGLYIASEIAKAHGGRIDVRSDDAETCFTFRMRLAS
ncbi:GAF domain-containing sensor histidine kinase [Rhizobium sp. SAFR-030]|uniref:sensor histidine kinase n=1 Tax=Rhizobium sp. SAFR-030 TaxID=3387277 RepID=UPI003F7F272E